MTGAILITGNARSGSTADIYLIGGGWRVSGTTLVTADNANVPLTTTAMTELVGKASAIARGDFVVVEG